LLPSTVTPPRSKGLPVRPSISGLPVPRGGRDGSKPYAPAQMPRDSGGRVPELWVTQSGLSSTLGLDRQGDINSMRETLPRLNLGPVRTQRYGSGVVGADRGLLFAPSAPAREVVLLDRTVRPPGHRGLPTGDLYRPHVGQGGGVAPLIQRPSVPPPGYNRNAG